MITKENHAEIYLIGALALLSVFLPLMYFMGINVGRFILLVMILVVLQVLWAVYLTTNCSDASLADL